MIKVFFGGSRKIGRLSQPVKERTDNIITNEHLLLLGDANGADKAMQTYLAEKNYRNVLVFCMGDVCRNNIGKWKTRNVHSSRSKKDFNYYSTKDVLMVSESDYGFMLWDGKSKGTLNNILNLCELNKKVLVYFSPSKSFYTVEDEQDVLKLLEHCEPDLLRKFERVLRISTRIHSRQQQLHFA
ncbi:MAG: hypothetical protein WAV28_04315 [Sedimentisphaerales bacterium]|jgi:hypothetical protein